MYLVPATDVETLSETPIDLFLSPDATAALEIDEPIEDLLDTKGDDYEQAPVDSDGVYRFETLPEGSHFVVWVPESDDDEHLPGGDNGRVAFDTDSLIGMQMDMVVSSRPSAAATYVGSSTCMVCHGLHSTTRTAHNVGLQVPGVRSLLQDIEPWPDFDAALEIFDTNSTTLYYYDCNDATLDPAKCSVDDEPPAAAVAFTINLRRDVGKALGEIGAYYIEMVNGTTERYDVVLTYGGALGRQQYLTRRSNPDGSLSYFVLPLQYNYEGDFLNPDPADWPWSDYRSDLWVSVRCGYVSRAGQCGVVRQQLCGLSLQRLRPARKRHRRLVCAGGRRSQWSLRLQRRHEARADQHRLRGLPRPGLRALGATTPRQLHRVPWPSYSRPPGDDLWALPFAAAWHRGGHDGAPAFRRERDASCWNSPSGVCPRLHEPRERCARGLLCLGRLEGRLSTVLGSHSVDALSEPDEVNHVHRLPQSACQRG